jgi:multiple sugar transport system permease protein
MTRGGPGTKSQTLPLYMYEQAFSFGNLGYGTAIAIMLLLVGAVFSLICLRALGADTR